MVARLLRLEISEGIGESSNDRMQFIGNAREN
jgi:hypothetical protein